MPPRPWRRTAATIGVLFWHYIALIAAVLVYRKVTAATKVLRLSGEDLEGVECQGPEVIMTVSPFFTCLGISNHLRGQRDNLHEPL